jgi:aspartyl-tRNA(Asn)/glutamyl-tRNA(Gln) amidotransferase subunit B
MFCGCANAVGGEPNTRTCPVCLGLPGALPTTNESAIDMGLKVALALNARVSVEASFDRKNYFYPDLPKGYQITQHGMPLATGGHLDFTFDGTTRRVRIRQVHLEEDAGKSIHMKIEGAPAGLLDMNRCGVPLVEIVTEPDISSTDEASAFLSELRSVLVYLGVADCNMHEGGLRFDTNVSLRSADSGEPGTQTEIKNLNSFRSVRRALSFEVDRQRRLLEKGSAVDYVTLLWDDRADAARTARSKEGASDYRYFPEPDLVSFTIERARVEALRDAQPELPAAARARIAAQYAIPEYDAGVLVGDRSVLELFESCADAVAAAGAGSPESVGKVVGNWVTVVLGGYLNEHGTGVSELAARFAPAARVEETDGTVPGEGIGGGACVRGIDVLARRLAEIVALRIGGALSEPAARLLFTEAVESTEPVSALVERLGLDEAPDEGALGDIVRELLAEHPDEVARYAAGSSKLLRYFVGEVMKRTGGKADPELASRLLAAQLAAAGRSPEEGNQT